jgi:hypothetical protein
MYVPWTWNNSNCLQFPFIFLTEVAHTELKFSIQIYQMNTRVSRSSSVLGTITPFLTEFLDSPFGLRKIPTWGEGGICVLQTSLVDLILLFLAHLSQRLK